MWERKTHLSIELAHVMNGHVDGLRWVGEYVGLGQPLAVGHQGGAVVHRHLRLHLLLPPVEAPTVHWAASQRCVIVDAGHAQGFVLLLRGESYAGDARAQREFLNNIGHKLNNTGILSLELASLFFVTGTYRVKEFHPSNLFFVELTLLGHWCICSFFRTWTGK